MISDSVLSFYVQHSYRLFFIRLIQSVNYCNNQTKMLVRNIGKCIQIRAKLLLIQTNIRDWSGETELLLEQDVQVLNMFYLDKPPENLQSYFNLIDERMDQSEKNQPVLFFDLHISNILLNIATVDGKVLLKQLLYSSNSDLKLRTSIVNYLEN